MTYPPQAPAPRPVPLEQPVDPTLAEWWQRLVARFVDNMVISLLASPAYILYFIWIFSQMNTMIAQAGKASPFMFNPLYILLWAFGIGAVVNLIGFGYDWLCHSKWGGTVGKRIMSIRVVRARDRGDVSGGMAAKRAMAYPLAGIVPFIGSIFVLVDVLWQFNDKATRQCLHDRFAETIVIRTDPPRPVYGRPGPPPGYPPPGPGFPR